MGGTVEVEGLTKSFGSQNIWRDVTLTLPPGEITALLGPSGTGKSVFLKSLMGLIQPEAGVAHHRRRRHVQGEGVAPPRAAQELRCPLPGRCSLRLDAGLRQRRIPATRPHQKVREGDQADRLREAGDGRPSRSGAQAARRDVRRHEQARRSRPLARHGAVDHPLRRARLGPRPGPYGEPRPAAPRRQHARPTRRCSSSPTTSSSRGRCRTTWACSTAASWSCSARARSSSSPTTPSCRSS